MLQDRNIEIVDVVGALQSRLDQGWRLGLRIRLLRGVPTQELDCLGVARADRNRWERLYDFDAQVIHVEPNRKVAQWRLRVIRDLHLQSTCDTGGRVRYSLDRCIDLHASLIASNAGLRR